MSESKSAILKKRIADALTKYPHLRDDMHRTLALVWKSDAKGANIDIEKYTLKEFLTEIAKGYDSEIFSNPESVRRLWQKVQQDNKELRGEKWAKRHGIDQHKRREEFRADEFKNDTPVPSNNSPL